MSPLKGERVREEEGRVRMTEGRGRRWSAVRPSPAGESELEGGD